MAKGGGYSHGLGLGLACFALVVAMAGATQFKVGGANGWSVPGANAESYNDWAEKTRFQIRDALVFVYPKEKDSVLLVEPADYNACNTSSYVKKFADGNTVFTFDRSGAFFFISGVDANCRANEKLIVMVLASRNGTATAPAPAASVSSPPPAPSSSPPTSPAPASPPPSSPSPPPATPPSSGGGAPAAAPTTTPTPPPASSSPPAPTPSSTPAPSASSPPAPPTANAPSPQSTTTNSSATSPPTANAPSPQSTTTNSSATSPPPASNGAVHAAVASGLVGSAAAGIIGYVMLAL